MCQNYECLAQPEIFVKAKTGEFNSLLLEDAANEAFSAWNTRAQTDRGYAGEILYTIRNYPEVCQCQDRSSGVCPACTRRELYETQDALRHTRIAMDHQEAHHEVHHSVQTDQDSIIKRLKEAVRDLASAATYWRDVTYPDDMKTRPLNRQAAAIFAMLDKHKETIKEAGE